jgi:hypothetical protein
MQKQAIIYAILNTINDRIYVCATVHQVETAICENINALKRGKHRCYDLQKEFNEYGIEHFTNKTLEVSTVESDKEMAILKQKWMNKFRHLMYNLIERKVICNSNENTEIRFEIKMMDFGRRVLRIYTSIVSLSRDGFNYRGVMRVVRGGCKAYKSYKWARVTDADKSFGIKWSKTANREYR